MCKIKVLAPQSARVQTEGDGERGKGEEEESSLEREEGDQMNQWRRLAGYFFSSLRGHFHSITVCPPSHSFNIIAKQSVPGKNK